MIRYHVLLEPLTPIHIGSGERIAPEEYLIRDNQLVRFNASRVMADFTPGQRRTFEAMLHGGKFQEAQKRLRHSCCMEHECYRVPMGSESGGELARALNNPERKAEVHMFVRNGADGRVLIPGSSIKGAMRTALVNHFLHAEPDRFSEIKETVRQQNKKHQWRTLEESTLGFAHPEMEWDPLRLLKVGDTVVPEGRTRVDRVINWNPDKGESAKMQMHFERLMSWADSDKESFAVPVELSVDDTAAHHPCNRRRFTGYVPTWDVLTKACNDFYLQRLRDEADRFFPKPKRFDWGRLCKQNEKGYQRINLDIKKRILLRIGRFSQHESLSVDDLRQGEDKEGKPIAKGKTRNMCVADRGHLPFGWVLLTLVE
ncbi:MAG: type III-A CRISPR-associated RAMP protein Csm5 [Magnetococcales bacterium]|nr:type III-A CRISPR-associated RAMP protein Csm5 [Magnetococcales bacterium]